MQKAKSNCWTCKERKIGCDRELPTCLNCRRGNRICRGYGIKLAWPDKRDGRRKQKSYDAVEPIGGSTKGYIQRREGGYVFLNTFVDDVEGGRVGVVELVRREGEGGERRVAWKGGLDVYRMQSVHGVGEGDGLLLGYYDSVISRMVTTIDDETNGFRLSLIPMALSSSDASSKSLLQVTLALSSFHLGKQDKALKYKVDAIKSLSESFSGGMGSSAGAVQALSGTDGESRLKQFAACMMLCVYSVFDSSDTTWHLHLQGAKSIAESFGAKEKQNPAYEFMVPWLDYHETFSGFSHNDDGLYGNERIGLKDIKLPESTPETRKIVGLLGCSTELLRLISCVNQLRAHSKSMDQSSSQSSYDFLRVSLDVRSRLLNAVQEIRIQPGETTGTINHRRITITAEFYHIAALLYLYQVAPPQAIPNANTISDLVRQGFDILDQLVVCTSPWPMFILACSVTDDRDRINVLDKLEIGARARRVGNYDIIKSLIQAVWKQQDLAADEKSKMTVDWRDLIQEGSCMPSFI